MTGADFSDLAVDSGVRDGLGDGGFRVNTEKMSHFFRVDRNDRWIWNFRVDRNDRWTKVRVHKVTVIQPMFRQSMKYGNITVFYP